ncbi:exocyst subunit exo70 family protein D1 [Abeliophyllum distichum]|uniref:Exocyst subunit Exo70 family protein n=1 Tax=Abeliophyllum distichum TaxID=126358 RepID=A0ABD1RY02_9LAMI
MGSSISHQSAAETIYHWHSNQAEQLIFDYGHREISRYLEAVDKIHQFPANGRESSELKSMAMVRLKREFQTVLVRQTDSLIGPNSTTEWSSVTDSTGYVIRYEDYSVYDSPSKEVIEYLRNVAERMNSGGKLGDCIRVYKSVRKNFLHTVLKRLRLVELTIGGDAKRFLWDELKMKIELWIQAAKVCFLILFDREKQICEKIFEGFGIGAGEECFVEIVKDSANNLLNFAETVSISNQPSERMGSILGLYDTLLSLVPKINALFDSASAEAIRSGAKVTVSRLEDDVRRMFYDFEKAVFQELSTISDDRGAIHPLTEYVMNYINLIVGHKKLLTNLIKSMPPLNFGDVVIPEGELGDLKGRSHLALHLILIIVVLQLNLTGKSEQYEHVPLRHLFVMNNVRYIVQKIEGSQELCEMIGDDYMKKLNWNVKLAMTSYQISTCDTFLSCFQDKGLYTTWCFSSQVSKRKLKKRLKDFNLVFEEIRVLHSHWTVLDLELQDELRVSMVDRLVPAYKEFLHKFRSHIKIEKHSEVRMKRFQKLIVKHSVEDLETLVSNDLFSYNEIIV